MADPPAAAPLGDGAAAERPETAQTLSRGLSVLELLAAAPEGRTPARIAADLRLSRPIVYRLLSTLAEHRMARRDVDGTWTVGLGVLPLVRQVHPALGERARGVLRDLAESTGATAHLAVADGAESVAVAVVEPRSALYHIAYRVGSRVPADVGALGRAILASAAGRTEVLSSTGEIIPGATGIATSVVGLGLPASVGVVSVHALDLGTVGPLVAAAGRRLVATIEPDIAAP
ncbi:IclR family transcriptional regulator [Nakamurella leprariae]|uniref:Helix-turn-helix domain-containing protein n=1 Tax=Nakamurella leprariae TaxID=2803911 RepID=A0A938YI49_9ACTN|nr:helix-turn-helix domain-containing protein [Nakamurella leprariae]MBM9468757.1 helix-turn-helix domain-containing protein [Nakamurella leprariae]